MKNPENYDWHELVAQKYATYSVQWCFNEGGTVRAKLRSNHEWDYETVGNADRALFKGLALISKQEKN